MYPWTTVHGPWCSLALITYLLTPYPTDALTGVRRCRSFVSCELSVVDIRRILYDTRIVG